MFPHYICENMDILAVITVQKNNFGFHGNQKTEGHKHQLNNFYFKYQLCQMKLRHLNTFLQFRLLFHEPHCTYKQEKYSPLVADLSRDYQVFQFSVEVSARGFISKENKARIKVVSLKCCEARNAESHG